MRFVAFVFVIFCGSGCTAAEIFRLIGPLVERGLDRLEKKHADSTERIITRMAEDSVRAMDKIEEANETTPADFAAEGGMLAIAMAAAGAAFKAGRNGKKVQT